MKGEKRNTEGNKRHQSSGKIKVKEEIKVAVSIKGRK